MRRLLPVLLFCMLILSSCELFTAQVPSGKLRLVIYANTYDNRARVTKLSSCENDAMNIDKAFSLLCAKYDVPYESVWVSDEVGPEGYESAVLSLSDEISPYDMTVFYFSCHGFSLSGEDRLGYGDAVSEMSYIAMIENIASKKEVPVDYGEGGDLLLCSDFLDIVSSLDGIKIVLSDFCYGGGLVDSDGMTIVPGAYGNCPDVFDLPAEFDVNVSSSVFCLTASRYNEKCYVDSRNHLSYFTETLLSALGFDVSSQTLGASIPCEDNGMITLGSLYRYVSKNDGKSEQNPSVSGGSQDIVIFRR